MNLPMQVECVILSIRLFAFEFELLLELVIHVESIAVDDEYCWLNWSIDFDVHYW